MTPFELFNTIEKEIASFTPKLSAAVNKALLYHGDSPSLIHVPGQSGVNQTLSFEESETVKAEKEEAHLIMMKVMETAALLESHSSWKLIADTRPPGKDQKMQLRYTLIRDKGI